MTPSQTEPSTGTTPATAVPRLGELLVERQVATAQDVAKALAFQQQYGGRIGSILVRLGALSEESLLPVLGQQLDNPIEYAWTMRALLTAMEQWVKEGALPPASQHPRLDAGTLVAADRVAFPAIPGVASPRSIPPARHGAAALPLLVPQVGVDGNELAGGCGA